jgi:hypothetical protein
VSNEIIAEIEALPQNREHKSILEVSKLMEKSVARQNLKEGDLVVRINGESICRNLDLLTAVKPTDENIKFVRYLGIVFTNGIRMCCAIRN